MAKYGMALRKGGKYADGSVPTDASTDAEAKASAADMSAQQPPMSPVVAAVTENTGLTGLAAGGIRAHNQALQDALNLANGAVKLKGPGTGTSDSIHGVSLSKGESVLPTDTTAAVGPANIAAMIAQTHTPVAKRGMGMGVQSGGKYADGVVPSVADQAADALKLNNGQATKSALDQGANLINAAPGPVAKMGAGALATGMLGAGALVDAGMGVVHGLNRGLGLGSLNAPLNDASAQTTPTPIAPPATPAAAPVFSTPTVPPSANGQPISKDTTYVSQPSGYGMAPKAGPAPLPVFGEDGTGYVKNMDTGATQVFQPKVAPPAAAPSAAQPSIADRATAWAKANAPAGADATTMSGYVAMGQRLLSGESENALQGAQTKELEQKTEQQTQVTQLQKEMSDPTIPDKRKVQIAEILHGMRGSGDVWMPYQSKDAMGMPTGDTLMYNRVTGETKAMPAPGGAAPSAKAPVEGSRSTSGGKPIVFKGGKWEYV